jgi:hypothetical protein
MGSVKQFGKNEGIAASEAPDRQGGPLDAARRRRLAALNAAEGLLKNRTDIPKDGVRTQEQLRAEWH